MGFVIRYLEALQAHDPKLYRELVKSGKLPQYLKQLGRERQDLLRILLANAERGPDGQPGPAAIRDAEEVADSMLTEFPMPPDPEMAEPPDDLPIDSVENAGFEPAMTLADLDPEVLRDSIRLTVMEIDEGHRSFRDYADRMVETFGKRVIPCLRQFYEMARWEPGFDNSGMSEPREIESALRELADQASVRCINIIR